MNPNSATPTAKTEKKAANTTNSPVWRNMVISVLTTILISAIVYFLGFNKPGGASKVEVQKATVEAWKGYVAIENLAYRNSISVMIDAGQFERYKDMYQEIMNESVKLQSALEQLIHKDDIDKDMVTLLKRRLENETKYIPAAEKLFTGMDKLLDTALNEEWTEERFNQVIGTRMMQYGFENKRMLDRLTTDIEELSKALSRRYDVVFDMEDFYFIQQERKKRDIYEIINDVPIDSSAADATREYFIGKWQPKNSKAIVLFNADGQYTWEVPTSNGPNITSGSWQITNRQLFLGFTPLPDSTGKKPKEQKWAFDITNVRPNAVCIQLVLAPYKFHTLLRQ